MTNSFQKSMEPFPGLEKWSRQVYLPVSNISLHIYDTGNEAGMPVLLLHGLGDEADTWRHVIPLIQENYRVIAPDFPGFGSSKKANKPHTISLFIDTMLELLNLLSITRVVLAGHSMGAMIAQSFALQHPERVERLVLISGSLVSRESRINPGLLLYVLPGLGEWLYNRLRENPQAAYLTLKPYYSHLDELPQADRDFLYQRVNERVWSDGQRQSYFSILRNLVRWLPSQQKDLPARLSGWKIPTVVIWGEDDHISPKANANALINLIPDASLVFVQGAGHNVQQEKAEVVAAAIQGQP